LDELKGADGVDLTPMQPFLTVNCCTAWYFSGQSVIISYQHCNLKMEIFHMDNHEICSLSFIFVIVTFLFYVLPWNGPCIAKFWLFRDHANNCYTLGFLLTSYFEKKCF
jgi:hypothetical protein